MASCLRRFLCPSIVLAPPPPLPLTLPFCHVCRETYRVAAGFLFSGDVLDDWKATWSDLRDTTCNRFIISFPLLLNSSVLVWGCHLVVRMERRHWKGFSRIVVSGLALSFLPLSSSGAICPHRRSGPAAFLFLMWRNAGWGHTEWGSDSFWEECERHTQDWRKDGGGWGKWFWPGSDSTNSARVWRWVGLLLRVYKHMVLCWGVGRRGPPGDWGMDRGGRGGGEKLRCVCVCWRGLRGEINRLGPFSCFHAVFLI